MTESVVLCEGYYDRAFWAGWLEHLGCIDPGRQPGKPGRVAVWDPWNKLVTGGQYGYRSKTDKFVRIVPCAGKQNVFHKMRNTLAEERRRMESSASQARLSRLIVSVDPDVSADATAETGFRRQDLVSLLRELDPSSADTRQVDVSLFGGATTVSLIRWEVRDPVAPGLPNEQTLERLVCAALVAAYPTRAPAVQGWLDSRPHAPKAGPKEFGWSYMAGWYAEFGCATFYQKIWLDNRVAAELRSRLMECGAWPIAEALAE